MTETPTVINKNHSELISAIKNHATTYLGEAVSKMFENAEQVLFELANKSTSNEEQNRYFELIRDLKATRPRLSGDYIERFSRMLRPHKETESETRAQLELNTTELSLVDEAVMEDMVMVKSMSGRVAGHFHESIAHMETRLEHLKQSTPEVFSQDALSPTSIYQVFNDTIRSNFNLSGKKILFELFNQHVGNKLGKVYDKTNKMLIEADVLPQIELHAPKPKPSPRRPAAPQNPDLIGTRPQLDETHTDTPDTANGMNTGGGQAGSHPAGPGGSSNQTTAFGVTGGPGERGQAIQPQQYGSYAVTAPPGSSYSGGSQQARGVESSSGGAPQSGTANEHAPAQAIGPGSGVATQGQSAGLPTEQVSHVIGNYIGAPIGAGGLPSADGKAATDILEATPTYYGHQDVLNALSGLQNQPQFESPSELKFDGQAVKQALLKQIAAQSGGVVTKRINEIATKTIDFIELIFDAIIEDEEISDTIKALLLRFQIPVIKASITDPEFFIEDNHVARVLLDTIAEIGAGVTDHADETYVQLNRITTDLLNEYEFQNSTFQKALDRLNAYANEKEVIVREKEEQTQKHVLKEHARNTVLKTLRRYTTGKSLPEDIHPLVLKRWPTLMFNHYLKNGKDNDEWGYILEALKDIIKSVQPINTMDEFTRLLASKERIVETTREYLNQTIQSSEDIDQVINGLTSTHNSVIENTGFNQNEITIAERFITEEKVTEAYKPLEEREIELDETETGGALKPELPPNVMPGMWFKVHVDDDSPARHCKLSVIIIEDSKLIFVNHDGVIICEKGFDEFSSELEHGKSKTIMGHSVFDHALNSVITHLEPQSMH